MNNSKNRELKEFRERERAWIRELQPGDVVQSGAGMFRVVRSISTSEIPYHTTRSSITFTIQRCSWTKKPYTVMTCNDLITLGYRKVRARVSLRNKFSEALAETFGAGKDCKLHCCDVRGIA